MSKKQFEEGQRIEITDAEFQGRAGRVEKVFKTRGQPTVYRVALEGERQPLSFIDGELVPLEQRRRITP